MWHDAPRRELQRGASRPLQPDGMSPNLELTTDNRQLTTPLTTPSDRVIFLPSQTPADYARLLSLADVFLDTPHYSAG